MVPTLLVAAALAAAPGGAPSLAVPALTPAPAPAAAGPAASRPLGLYEEWEEDDRSADERRRHVMLAVWAGEAFADAGSGPGSSFFSAEAAWLFSRLDLGVAGAAYRNYREAGPEWTPVVLARITQRFVTRRGIEAAFTLGLGAGRPRDWEGWFQVALGVRIPLGPLFLGGELAFEQVDLLRFGGGLGVSF